MLKRRKDGENAHTIRQTRHGAQLKGLQSEPKYALACISWHPLAVLVINYNSFLIYFLIYGKEYPAIIAFPFII